jgi:hypothetical protein
LVEYRLEGLAEAEPLYRLATTILAPARAPAAELAALYHERWEIEGALAALKTQLRGAKVVLRSKTPELVRQEVWGLLLAHFAVRGLMHGAGHRPARVESQRRPGPVWGMPQTLLAPGARGPPQGAAIRSAFPLRPGASCIGRCWTRSSKSAR